MKNILIGSRAIKHWFRDFPREPKDFDYIGNGSSIAGKLEFHKNPIFDNYKFPIMQPNDIYTLKMSHMFWDINWEKHLYDIQFLKSKGCKLDRSLFDKLYPYWNDVHGKNKRSDLKMSKEDFFDNALKEFDHDGLHELLVPIPMYKKVLKDGAEVEVDENKYNQLTYEEKLELVREEVYVMAYERLHNRDYRTAYSWMLKKFIISHAPIFEALFIIENHKALYKPIINYKQKLDYELSRIRTKN
jgi:hypothetical protein